MRRNQRVSTGAAALAFAAFLIAGVTTGCGGSKDPEAIVDTGTGGNGVLRTVQISPPPGEVFISRGTTFQISWTPENPPPPHFEAVLMRYREATDEEDQAIEPQRTVVVRASENAFVWNIERADNFDLDRGGVYFLRLSAPGEVIERTYIVSGERAAVVKVPEARRGEDGGGDSRNDAFSHAITVR